MLVARTRVQSACATWTFGAFHSVLLIEAIFGSIWSFAALFGHLFEFLTFSPDPFSGHSSVNVSRLPTLEISFGRSGTVWRVSTSAWETQISQFHGVSLIFSVFGRFAKIPNSNFHCVSVMISCV